MKRFTKVNIFISFKLNMSQTFFIDIEKIILKKIIIEVESRLLKWICDENKNNE